jgi:hypothetical protein
VNDWELGIDDRHQHSLGCLSALVVSGRVDAQCLRLRNRAPVDGNAAGAWQQRFASVMDICCAVIRLMDVIAGVRPEGH